MLALRMDPGRAPFFCFARYSTSSTGPNSAEGSSGSGAVAVAMEKKVGRGLRGGVLDRLTLALVGSKRPAGIGWRDDRREVSGVAEPQRPCGVTRREGAIDGVATSTWKL